jgi:hypothetical protein
MVPRWVLSWASTRETSSLVESLQGHDWYSMIFFSIYTFMPYRPRSCPLRFDYLGNKGPFETIRLANLSTRNG